MPDFEEKHRENSMVLLQHQSHNKEPEKKPVEYENKQLI
jgi:hypothetical protein